MARAFLLVFLALSAVSPVLSRGLYSLPASILSLRGNSSLLPSQSWAICNPDGLSNFTACASTLVTSFGAAMFNGKLPDFQAFQQAVGTFSQSNCEKLSAFAQCTSPVSECVSLSSFQQIAQSDDDAYDYSGFLVISTMQCNQPNRATSLVNCMNAINTASTDDQSAMQACRSKDGTLKCDALHSAFECIRPVLKRVCGDVSGICTYFGEMFKMERYADEACIDANEKTCINAAPPLAFLTLVAAVLAFIH